MSFTHISYCLFHSLTTLSNARSPLLSYHCHILLQTFSKNHSRHSHPIKSQAPWLLIACFVVVPLLKSFNCCSFTVFTERHSNASTVLGVVTIILSVSHTRALWQIKELTADILTLHEKAIRLVFRHQQWLAGDVPFHLKFALKVTYLYKNADVDRLCS